MGKIKKILENELVGGTQTTDVYPVTSTKAVYNEYNERLDDVLRRNQEKLTEFESEFDKVSKNLMLSILSNTTNIKGRIIAEGEFSARADFDTYIVPVKQGETYLVIGMSGYSLDWALYSEFNGTTLNKADVTSIGTFYSADVEFKNLVKVETNGFLAFCSKSSYQEKDLQKVSSFNNMLEEIDVKITKTKNDVLNNQTIDSILTWETGGIKPSTGTIIPSIGNIVAHSNFVEVKAGERLFVRVWLVNNNDYTIIAAYNANKEYISEHSVVGEMATRVYRLVEYVVPDGVCFIRISTFIDSEFDTRLAASISKNGIDILDVKEVNEQNFISASFLSSGTHGKWYTPKTNKRNIILTKCIPSKDLEYIEIGKNYRFSIHQYDENLQYMNTLNGLSSFNKDVNSLDANCVYILIEINEANVGDVIFSDTGFKLYYGNDLILTMKEFYDKKVIKDAFLNAVVVNDYEHDKMAHGSRVIIGKDGNIFTSYYYSLTYENESQSAGDAIALIKVNPCNLYNVQRVDALKKGEVVGDFAQNIDLCPYDPNILMISDSKYRLFMVIDNGGGNTIGYRDFNPGTLEMADSVNLSNIRYKGRDYVFSKSNLEDILTQEFGESSASRVGNYPILTAPFREYNGYVYTYLWSLVAPSVNVSVNGWQGAIIRTNDNGQIWEIVSFCTSQISWNSHTNWEAGFEIVNNTCFVLFRNTVNTCPITSYNIETGEWGEVKELIPLQIPFLHTSFNKFLADPSRPEVIYYNGFLYAIQNIQTSVDGVDAKNVFRGMMCVWKLDLELNVIDYRIFQNAFGVSYMSLSMKNGYGYFGFTEDRTALHQTEQNYNKRHISIMPVPMGLMIW